MASMTDTWSPTSLQLRLVLCGSNFRKLPPTILARTRLPKLGRRFCVSCVAQSGNGADTRRSWVSWAARENGVDATSGWSDTTNDWEEESGHSPDSQRKKWSGALRHLRRRARAVSSPAVHVRDKIDLTEKEQRIFDRLLATVRHFNLPTQVRVAGGWVRDKLLDRECNDIDIVVDDMLGREFAKKVDEYLASIGEKAKGLVVIPSKPDKSKHVEIARMWLYDECIDFVNLLSENPTQMDFGTAEEDAYRRDITINSLFYNLNTSSVEDLTGRGIEDLKSGKIVTPLPPKERFLDDPLRVLRAIRFGARFRFSLDEELKKSAASNDVGEALATKISRERIGTEIDLMMSGNDPVTAVNYISELNLFSAVFSFPPNYKPRLPEDWERLCVSSLDATWNLLQTIESHAFTDEQRRLALYASLFLPFRKEIDNEKNKIPVVSYISRKSLKRSTSDAYMTLGLHNAAERFSKLIPFLESDSDVESHPDPDELDMISGFLDVPVSSKLQVAVGLVLRDIKDFWRVASLISTLLHTQNGGCDLDSSNNGYQLERRRRIYVEVENAIITLGIEKVWEVKSLVNGKEIMDLLQLKAGAWPLLKEWQKRVFAWQLTHPSGTAEECLDWIKEANLKHERLQ